MFMIHTKGLTGFNYGLVQTSLRAKHIKQATKNDNHVFTITLVYKTVPVNS